MKNIADIQRKIDFKTKPLGSLGMLEKVALQIADIQHTESPKLQKPTIVVFAGDHGIAREGVSAYPQEVTYQMVMNFLNGGAAINVFTRQNNIALKVVDAGVNFDFPKNEKLIDLKVAKGTRSFLKEEAMSKEELMECVVKGRSIVLDLHKSGCNVVGFGEMGIGNTSAAAMIMSTICRLPLEECVGRGTGVNDEQLNNKLNVLKASQSFHGQLTHPIDILHTFGGFEMGQMFGAMMTAYEHDMIILVDGFIATSVFLVAYSMNPDIIKHAVFCHQSDEAGHSKMLQYLGATPLLNLGMRLGEGTGCAVAYPLIQSAVNFLNEMASFEEAQVSNI